MASSNTQHQEGKAGVGADWEATSEGGGRANSLGTVLPRSSAGSTIVWGKDMGAHGDNDLAFRGIICEFIEAGHT